MEEEEIEEEEADLAHYVEELEEDAAFEELEEETTLPVSITISRRRRLPPRRKLGIASRPQCRFRRTRFRRKKLT